MDGLSINWKQAAKVGGLVAAAIVALAMLPSLLRSPEPPPLDPEVGLTAIEPDAPRPPGPSAREPVERRAEVGGDVRDRSRHHRRGKDKSEHRPRKRKEPPRREPKAKGRDRARDPAPAAPPAVSPAPSPPPAAPAPTTAPPEEVPPTAGQPPGLPPAMTEFGP